MSSISGNTTFAATCRLAHTSSGRTLNAILSYTHDGDIFSIDPIHAYTDKPAWDRFLKEFNEFALQEERHSLAQPEPVRRAAACRGRLRGEDGRTSLREVKTADPQGRMLNPFFADLLSGEPVKVPKPKDRLAYRVHCHQAVYQCLDRERKTTSKDAPSVSSRD